MTTSTALPTIAQQTTRDPAGWYPDPWYPDPIGSASWLRYWDGTDWTAETALTVGDDAQQPAPTEPAAEEPPAEPATTYDLISTWSPPPVLPTRVSTPTRAWWKRGGVLVACGLLAIAIVAATRHHHQTTMRASLAASTRLSHPTSARLSVRITSPADGATVHAQSVVIKGVVSRSHARVRVNGDSVVVSGHRFAMRVPLHLGDNDFDISAVKTGLEAGLTSVSVVRTRSASERADLLGRRDARRSAGQRQERSAAQQRGGAGLAAPTTSSGGGASTTGTTVEVVGADAELAPPPPNAAEAPPTSEPTPPPPASEPSPPPTAPTP
jgi:hypothetical protein